MVAAGAGRARLDWHPFHLHSPGPGAGCTGPAALHEVSKQGWVSGARVGAGVESSWGFDSPGIDLPTRIAVSDPLPETKVTSCHPPISLTPRGQFLLVRSRAHGAWSWMGQEGLRFDVVLLSVPFGVCPQGGQPVRLNAVRSN